MRIKLYFVTLVVIALTALTVGAQTNTFTYQGRLTDNNLAAVGTYEMQFRVFDAALAGNQLPVGTPVTLNFTVAGTNPVTVSNGAFTVQLNFGNGVFTGADRWLEISVRKPSDPPGFTLLTPRQPITSSPYSIKTLNANAADSLSSACVLCITDAQISGIAGAKVTGAVANATNAATATTATTAGNVSGVVGIANGGTGSATQNFVDLTTAQTVGGNKTFSGNVSVGGMLTTTPSGYLFAYDTTQQPMSGPFSFVNITFNTSAEINGWTHSPSSSSFTCNQSGTYQITFSGTTLHQGASQQIFIMRALKNGTEIPGSLITDDNVISAGWTHTSHTFIVRVVTGDVIVVQMAGNLILQPPGWNGDIRTSATLAMTRVM